MSISRNEGVSSKQSQGLVFPRQPPCKRRISKAPRWFGANKQTLYEASTMCHLCSKRSFRPCNCDSAVLTLNLLGKHVSVLYNLCHQTSLRSVQIRYSCSILKGTHDRCQPIPYHHAFGACKPEGGWFKHSPNTTHPHGLHPLSSVHYSAEHSSRGANFA